MIVRGGIKAVHISYSILPEIVCADRDMTRLSGNGYAVTSVALIAPVSSTAILNFLVEPSVEELIITS